MNKTQEAKKSWQPMKLISVGNVNEVVLGGHSGSNHRGSFSLR